MTVFKPRTWQAIAFSDTGILILLALLQNQGAARRVEEQTGGQPTERWFAEEDAVAQMIAELGENGWEMTVSGTTVLDGMPHSLYLKHPKQQE